MQGKKGIQDEQVGTQKKAGAEGEALILHQEYHIFAPYGRG